MTRENIIRMAREAGLIGKPIFTEGLEHFAALVASAEREACAKVCEENWHERGGQCANVIRTRGQA